MATIYANLFIRFQPGDPVDDAHNRLLFNQFGGTPAIPALNAGDTLALSAFYLGQGSGNVPFRGARYPTSVTTVRLRAAGNNHIYATADSSSEIIPATGATITRTATGTGTVVEKQHVVFGNLFTGTFKIAFSGAGSGGRGGGISLQGTTAAIPITALASDILAAILNVVGFYHGNDGPYTFPDLVARYGAQTTQPIVTGTPTTGFTVEFGQLYGGASYWNTSIHLLTIDDSDVQYGYGWNVSLALTAVDFTDLFLPANAPAYLEVLINGGYAAQYLLTTPGGVSGAPPGPLPGSGGPPGNVNGIIYDGDHFGSPWAVGAMLTEDAFPEAPGYHIFRQRYRCARSRFANLPLDSPCPEDGNAGLVLETARQDVSGADLEEWERVWAHVPPPIVDAELVDYVWQTTGTIGGAWAIRSLPLTRLAVRTRTFFRTANPASIPVQRLPRASVFAGVRLLFDGYVDLYGGASTIARDDKLDRWMGNIWVRTHWQITI